jgi:hypothetical protein
MVGHIAQTLLCPVPFGTAARASNIGTGGRPPEIRGPLMRVPLPFFVKLWFGLDLVLALFPPLHWAASGTQPIFGVPRPLFYLYGTSLFIAASVVVAYLWDKGVGGHQGGDR